MRSNAEWLRRFRREGQAARRFRHPNSVTVYDLRTSSDGTIYMVMEYVEGHTLDAELKARGRFTPAEALTVLEPIMSVLNAAHAMGVVHRDLKPENIMIGKASTGGEPQVKLLLPAHNVSVAEPVFLSRLATAVQQVNQGVWKHLPPEHVAVESCRADELVQRRGLTAALDERWSYVGKKAAPRWRWHAIAHASGTVVAYGFGRRQATVFLQLKEFLEP